jgi:hypothetical protein
VSWPWSLLSTIFCAAAAVYCSWAHWTWHTCQAMVSILPPMAVSSGKFCHGQILFGTWISWWWLPVDQRWWSSRGMWLGSSDLGGLTCAVIALWTHSHSLQSQRIPIRVVCTLACHSNTTAGSGSQTRRPQLTRGSCRTCSRACQARFILATSLRVKRVSFFFFNVKSRALLILF